MYMFRMDGTLVCAWPVVLLPRGLCFYSEARCHQKNPRSFSFPYPPLWKEEERRWDNRAVFRGFPWLPGGARVSLGCLEVEEREAQGDAQAASPWKPALSSCCSPLLGLLPPWGDVSGNGQQI